MEKTISVVILSKNNGRTLGFTLLSVLKSKLPPGYSREVIVVDAHSTDNTQRILDRFRPYIKVIYDEGRGIGIARNIGVLASKGSYICFVDADCIVGADHFARVVEAFERGADVVDVKAGGSQASTKIERLEELVWRYGRAYSEEMMRGRCFAGGAFIAFKRDVFDRVKGFWLYPPYGADDLDFSFRAWKAGFRISVVEVPGTASRFRRGVRELIRQQIGWGRGIAHVIARYRHDRDYWRCYKLNPFLYRVLGDAVWLYPIVAALLAPVRGFQLSLKTRKPEMFFYWTVRRWAFLYGILSELRRAFLAQGVRAKIKVREA